MSRLALAVLLGLASLPPLARAQEAVPVSDSRLATDTCGPQADPAGLLAALEAIGDPAATDAAEAIRLLLERARLACQEREELTGEITALRQAIAARGRLLEIARETTEAYEAHTAEVDRLLPKLTGRRWGCTAGPGVGYNFLTGEVEDRGAAILGVLCGLHL